MVFRNNRSKLVSFNFDFPRNDEYNGGQSANLHISGLRKNCGFTNRKIGGFVRKEKI
jgi:hypothetical protein